MPKLLLLGTTLLWLVGGCTPEEMLLGASLIGLLQDDFKVGLSAYQRGDYTAAHGAWRPLAERGHAEAQYNLGLMYNTGRGVPRNDVQAVHWYRMAADQGTAEAQLALGLMYLGVRYVKHVKGVVHVGVRSMKRELATEDVVEAVRWFRMAAERGVAEAQAILGIMYAEGQGMPQEMHKHMLGSTLPPLKATRMLRKTRRSSLNL